MRPPIDGNRLDVARGFESARRTGIGPHAAREHDRRFLREQAVPLPDLGTDVGFGQHRLDGAQPVADYQEGDLAGRAEMGDPAADRNHRPHMLEKRLALRSLGVSSGGAAR